MNSVCIITNFLWYLPVLCWLASPWKPGGGGVKGGELLPTHSQIFPTFAWICHKYDWICMCPKYDEIP